MKLKPEEKLKLVGNIFSPAAPIQDRSLFFGRIEQLRKLSEAIETRGQHAILYGDRGVGKTSLANIASFIYPNVVVSKVTCNRTEDFKSLWSKALNKISFTRTSAGLGFNASQTNESMQLGLFIENEETVDSRNIESVLENLGNDFLIIFDEFDSVKSDETKTKMADTIKALSDNVPHVTIMIVGIGASVTDLIGSHPSIERCILQVQMPRMSSEELDGIIVNGMSRLELRIDEQTKRRIIDYSSGFPSYTHLLCKYSAINTIRSEREEILYQDFSDAVRSSIENVNQSLREAFHKAILSQKSDSNFQDVVFSCALARTDQYNCFAPNDILSEYNNLTGRKSKIQQITYHIRQLASEERGEILERVGPPNNVKLRFKNPMMKAFIRLNFHLRTKST